MIVEWARLVIVVTKEAVEWLIFLAEDYYWDVIKNTTDVEWKVAESKYVCSRTISLKEYIEFLENSKDEPEKEAPQILIRENINKMADIKYESWILRPKEMDEFIYDVETYVMRLLWNLQ